MVSYRRFTDTAHPYVSKYDTIHTSIAIPNPAVFACLSRFVSFLPRSTGFSSKNTPTALLSLISLFRSLTTISIALALSSIDTMIKSLGLLIAIICALASLTNAFNTTPMQFTISRRHGTSSSLSMIFGPPKDDGKPGDYVCKVNAEVFTYQGCIYFWVLSY